MEKNIRQNFQPLLDNKKKTLTKDELTDFVERLIVDLKEEVEAGVLTELELNDYINLFEMTPRHIFRKYPEYHEEVLKFTEPTRLIVGLRWRT